MSCIQKACEESQGNVVVVKGVGIIVCTTLPYAQEDLGKQDTQRKRTDESVIIYEAKQLLLLLIFLTR